MSYQLWDGAQGRACHCDSSFYGLDCSLRKCPKGDDPLTVTSYDAQCSSTTDSYSPYAQSTEKQSFSANSANFPREFRERERERERERKREREREREIDREGENERERERERERKRERKQQSATNPKLTSRLPLEPFLRPLPSPSPNPTLHRTVVGTFKLTYVDEFGARYQTAPIDARPMVSDSATTTAGSTTLTFVNKPTCSKVGKGDRLIVGASIRSVTAVSKEHTTGVCLVASVTVDAAYSGSSAIGSGGAQVFKMNVDTEIKEALEALPNGVIKSVNVRHMTVGHGAALTQTAAVATSTAKIGVLEFAAALATTIPTTGSILSFNNGEQR